MSDFGFYEEDGAISLGTSAITIGGAFYENATFIAGSSTVTFTSAAPPVRFALK